MTGGGVRVAGDPTKSFLSATGTKSPRKWYSVGWHYASVETKLTAWGICIDRTHDVETFRSSKSVGSGSARVQHTATCGEGRLVGGGIRAIGDPTRWVLNSTRTVDDLADSDTAPADGILGELFHYASDDPDSVKADAVCLKGEPTSYKSQSITTAAPFVEVRARCGKGSVVSGGAGFASGADLSHIVETRPFHSANEHVPADGWVTKFSNPREQNLKFEVTAICL